ncbi:uncharacterized protein LOC141700007 [Apium graveolens]|uniref:uncharacterized protein LOC141700007 n=1 Tax=Apium graveolens TaxID=4045 RepID=UPI003D79F7CF
MEPNLVSKVKEAQKNDTGLEAIRSEVAGGKQKHFRVDDEGVIWLGSKLCVPVDPTIREKILKEAHSFSFSIHPGSTKMKNDVIWVVVDRLTKSAHFLPIRETTHVHELAEIFQRDIVRLHDRWTVGKDDPYIGRYVEGMCFGVDRAPSCWDDVGERVIEGQELVRITNEKLEIVKEILKEARSRQKSYADQHRKFGVDLSQVIMCS